jgi:DNA topoisomerase-1
MRDVKREERPTDLKCEKCGSPMVIKWGRRGEFLACSGYPECRNTMNFTRDEAGTIVPEQPEVVDETCEKCGRPMQVRFGRFGKFIGCTGYPECKNIKPLHKPKPTGVKCAVCADGELLERRSRRGKTFFSCSRYPDCTAVAWDRPIPAACPSCAAPFVTEKTTKRLGTVRRCVREGCGWQAQVDPDDPNKLIPLPPVQMAAKVARRRPTRPKPGAEPPPAERERPAAERERPARAARAKPVAAKAVAKAKPTKRKSLKGRGRTA